MRVRTSLFAGLVGVTAFLLVAVGCSPAEAPSDDDRADLADLAGVEETVFYGEREREQFGVLTLPTAEPTTDGYPVVILVHGGFWSEPWDYTLMSPLVDDLVADGYATWNIEFRRLGGFGGYPETFDDVAAAIDALADVETTRPLDLARSVLVGHSSGGHLALWALGRPDARVQPVGAVGLGAVVDLEAFTQARRLLGGTVDAVPERYEAAAPVLDAARVRLVHGENDHIVPLSTLAPAETAGVPVEVVADADHFAVIDPQHAAWSAARAAIEELVGRAP